MIVPLIALLEKRREPGCKRNVVFRWAFKGIVVAIYIDHRYWYLAGSVIVCVSEIYKEGITFYYPTTAIRIDEFNNITRDIPLCSALPAINEDNYEYVYDSDWLAYQPPKLHKLSKLPPSIEGLSYHEIMTIIQP